MDLQWIDWAVHEGAEESEVGNMALDIIFAQAILMMAKMRVFDRMHRPAEQYAEHKHHQITRAAREAEVAMECIVGDTQTHHEHDQGGEDEPATQACLPGCDCGQQPRQRQGQLHKDLAPRQHDQIAPFDSRLTHLNHPLLADDEPDRDVVRSATDKCVRRHRRLDGIDAGSRRAGGIHASAAT